MHVLFNKRERCFENRKDDKPSMETSQSNSPRKDEDVESMIYLSSSVETQGTGTPKPF